MFVRVVLLLVFAFQPFHCFAQDDEKSPKKAQSRPSSVSASGPAKAVDTMKAGEWVVKKDVKGSFAHAELKVPVAIFQRILKDLKQRDPNWKLPSAVRRLLMNEKDGVSILLGSNMKQKLVDGQRLLVPVMPFKAKFTGFSGLNAGKASFYKLSMHKSTLVSKGHTLNYEVIGELTFKGKYVYQFKLIAKAILARDVKNAVSTFSGRWTGPCRPGKLKVKVIKSAEDQ